METALLKDPAQAKRTDSLSDETRPKQKRARKREPEIRARALGQTGGGASLSHNLLSPAQQQLLHSIATLLDYPRGGEHIYSEGDAAAFVYFIDEGLIRISRLTENGRRQILAFRGRGDIFGLPDAGQHANSAETVSAVRLFRVSWPQLQELMLGEPQFLHMLFTKLANQVRDAQRRILMLGQQNIHQRLAAVLLDFLDLPEFFDSRRSHLKLPVNRFDLADYLGTAPESTARAFARLESEGLVKRLPLRTIEICDLAGLRALQNERRRSHR